MVANLRLVSTPAQTSPGPSSQSPIRVVLADDHAVMRRSLRVVLEREEHIDVIAEAADLTSAVRHVRRDKPHVLLLDLDLSTADGSGMEAIEQLRERTPETQIVVLTMEDSPVVARHVLASGALGFVVKQLADNELPQAVRAAARGEDYVSPRVAARLDARYRR